MRRLFHSKVEEPVKNHHQRLTSAFLTPYFEGFFILGVYFMPRGIPKTPTPTAINNPVIRTTADPVSENDIGQGNTRLLKSTGDSSQAMEPSVIARVGDQPLDDEKMQMLAFLNEPVTVRIGTTTDKNAPQVFEINVNAGLHFFKRGEVKTVPRYIVDRMLRLKPTVYSQKEVINSEGIKDILHIPSTGMLYDFSIERDDNPMGDSWKRAVLAEAG